MRGDQINQFFGVHQSMTQFHVERKSAENSNRSTNTTLMDVKVPHSIHWFQVHQFGDEGVESMTHSRKSITPPLESVSISSAI